MARVITPFLLQTRFEVDPKQGRAAFKTIEGDVDHLTTKLQKAGKEATAAFKGAEAGKKFGSDFGNSAASSLIGALGGGGFGQTLGALIGTTIAPGIGSAIGSSLGGAVDTALGKVSGAVMQLISQGMELNKELEATRIEFTTFAGSESQAVKYLEDLKKLSMDTGLRMGVLVEASEHVFDLTNNLKDTSVILRAAIDQAADFGGKAETVAKIADALALITEKGSLAGKELSKLYKLGIDAPQRLAEATGMSVQRMKQLISQDRVKGDVAARIIALSIERDKGGYAKYLAQSSIRGAENRVGATLEIRAAEGTERITRGIGDLESAVANLLGGGNAQKFVDFLNALGGSVVSGVEKAVNVGVNLGQGIASGIASGDVLEALTGSMKNLSKGLLESAKSVFDFNSPSKVTNELIGVPLGQGLADGVGDGFAKRFADQTTEQIVASLEALLDDPRVKAFLATIQWAEGGAPNRIVGGKTVSDLSRHPNIVGLRTAKGPSTAAGSYQITGSNWYGRKGHPGLQQTLGLPDFSPKSQDLAALYLFMQRGGLTPLLSGDLAGAMKIAGKDWTSTPGSTIGGGGQRGTAQWVAHFDAALGANGKAVTTENPMPVVVVTGTSIAATQGFAAQDYMYGNDMKGLANNYRRGRSPRPGPATVSFDPSSLAPLPGEAERVNNKYETDAIAKGLWPVVTKFDESMLNVVTLLPQMSDSMFAAMMKQRDAARDVQMLALGAAPELHKSMAMIREEDKKRNIEINREIASEASRLLGGLREQFLNTLQSVTGQIPSQQVGKKRGLFSKILGIAAPFLSFIPGIGPILSTIAGAASQAIGGNYGGAISSIAGGFQSGGVFTHPSGSGTSNRPSGNSVVGPGGLTIAPGVTLFGHRARGGPVRRGGSYCVGEEGPEPFIPSTDGYVLPHGSRVGSQGSYDPMTEHIPRLIAALERQETFLSRLEGISAGQMVRLGAHTIPDAMSSNQALTTKIGQRLRLP